MKDNLHRIFLRSLLRRITVWVQGALGHVGCNRAVRQLLSPFPAMRVGIAIGKTKEFHDL